MDNDVTLRSSPMDNDVTLWIGKLKSGDDQAARQIWDQFFQRVCGLAHKKLGGAPRRASDAEDLALSAFNALCIGAREGKFRELEDRQDLWQLLAVITARKAAQAWRKQARRAEVGESIFARFDDAAGLQNVSDSSPEFLDSLSGACQDLLEGLLDDRLREVALLRLQGYSNAEIADAIGRSEKSVERYLKLIRESWSAQHDEA